MSHIVAVSNWYQFTAEYVNTYINPYKNLEAFLQHAEEAIYRLPYAYIQPLLQFKAGMGANYVILKGFEQDPELIPTYQVETDIFNNKKKYFSEFWLAMVAKILGDPIGYTQERNGEVFQNVRPRQGQENKIASDSSSIILDLHVENGYHPIRPDFLLLYCLRKDPDLQGYTLAVEIKHLLKHFSDEEIFLLRSKQFRTSVDWNFGNLNAERGTGPLVSILFGNHENPMIFYDDEYVIGISVTAQKVLDKLRIILHENVNKILLQPGEMLIFDNYKSLHGRTAFKAYYDGHDRWLQRLLIVRDLSLNQKLLQNTGRIFNWSYRAGEYYGNVEY